MRLKMTTRRYALMAVSDRSTALSLSLSLYSTVTLLIACHTLVGTWHAVSEYSSAIGKNDLGPRSGTVTMRWRLEAICGGITSLSSRYADEYQGRGLLVIHLSTIRIYNRTQSTLYNYRPVMSEYQICSSNLLSSISTYIIYNYFRCVQVKFTLPCCTRHLHRLIWVLW